MTPDDIKATHRLIYAAAYVHYRDIQLDPADAMTAAVFVANEWAELAKGYEAARKKKAKR